MITNKLIGIRDRILQYCPFFSAGYSDVYQDDELGIIADGNEIVFPNDTLGDYFYLRIPDTNTFRQNNSYRISDKLMGYESVSNIYLVAVVANADPDILISNIVNLIRDQEGVILRDWVGQSGVILRRELSKLDGNENIQAALQRLDSTQTIVSVGFSITVPVNPYVKPDCLPNPCKEC